MITLEELQARDLFPSWDGFVKPVASDGAQQILQDFMVQLRALQATDDEAVKALVKESVQALNKLDVQHGFICTIEREDLCDVSAEILAVARYAHPSRSRPPEARNVVRLPIALGEE